MNGQLVFDLLAAPAEESIRRLLDDEATVFWVDWREEDDAIVDACETVLATGELAGELVETDSDEGFEVYVRYGKTRLRVPLTFSGADRHVTLLTLNEALSPDFEVRFCRDSAGSDTLAFLPLPVPLWDDLERRFGGEVGRRFARLAARPNLFTDEIPASGEHEPMP